MGGPRSRVSGRSVGHSRFQRLHGGCETEWFSEADFNSDNMVHCPEYAIIRRNAWWSAAYRPSNTCNWSNTQ